MRVALVGYGTVGRAVAKLLEEQGGDLARRHGLSPRLVGVADSKGTAWDARGLSASELEARKTKAGSVGDRRAVDEVEWIEGIEADVVVEAAPTRLADPTPAVERLKAAFRTGKHVVCVNKAPLAVAMPALQELAAHNRVQFRFSGTVGGGTPVLDWAARCAVGDRVLGVRAILNGTTNSILTRMREGLAFDEALAEAQRRGYAEADPSMDVDGVDTAIKLVILANAVLGRRAVLGDVRVRGIRGIAEAELAAAAEAGWSIRLVGEVAEDLRVAPKRVKAGSPLDVGGTLNAVTLELAAGGEVTLVGKGAGGRETATSVVRDLVAIWHRIWEGRR